MSRTTWFCREFGFKESQDEDIEEETSKPVRVRPGTPRGSVCPAAAVGSMQTELTGLLVSLEEPGQNRCTDRSMSESVTGGCMHRFSSLLQDTVEVDSG